MGVDALRLSFSIEGADEVENIMKMNADSVKATPEAIITEE